MHVLAGITAMSVIVVCICLSSTAQGVDMNKLKSAGEFICNFLQRPSSSKVALALNSKL